MTKLLRSLEERLATGHTALLVVDMQNDFCAETGYITRELGRDVRACREIVPALNDLVAAAREAGIPVVWIVAEYDDDDIPAPMLAKKLAAGISAVSCARGSWGAEAFGVTRNADEPVVVKHNYSGFVGTELHTVLASRGIATLVFAGVQTNVCVESTLRDAHAMGYYVVVAEDCVASHMPAQHQATLDNVRFLFGDVTDSGTIAGAWRRSEVLS